MKLKRIVIIMLATLFLFAGLNYFFSNSLQSKFFVNMFTSFYKVIFKNESYPLVVPKFDSIEDNDLAFENHFKGNEGHFVLVKENTISKQAPNIESKEYEKLYETQRVRILFEKKQPNTYENIQRTWVFIGTEQANKYLGWIFKDELIFVSDFEKFRTNQFYNFSYTKGEFSGNLKMRGNGLFTLNWKSEGGGLYLEGSDRGRLNIYENIIWAKKHKQDYIYEFFRLDETNHLFHEFKYRFDSIKLDIYKLPNENTSNEKSSKEK